MASPIILATAVEAGFGTLLIGTILYLVLSRGRKAYHYIFAALLTTFFIWDLGVFLMMMRNEHVNELPIIALVIAIPCSAIPTLIYHFTVVYVRKPIKWLLILAWVAAAISFVAVSLGLAYNIVGVHRYDWGYIFAVEPKPLDALTPVLWFGMILPSCWLLYRHAKAASSELERRHARYIMAGFLVAAFAIVKVLVVMGINVPFLLPLGMFLTDVFAAIIGLAIIKDRLLDITVIVSKGTLYSMLAAIAVFVFSISEHLLTTYISHLIGEDSEIPHLISIAIGIAVVLPVKQRLERRVEHFFSQRKLVF